MFQIAVMQFCGVKDIPGVTEGASRVWEPGKLGWVCGGQSIPDCKKFYGASTDEDLASIACSVCSHSKGSA